MTAVFLSDFSSNRKARASVISPAAFEIIQLCFPKVSALQA